MLLGYFFPPFSLLPLSPNLIIRNAKRTIHDTAERILRRKHYQIDQDGRRDSSIVGVMIQENRKNRDMGIGDSLTETDLIDQIKTFLLAGFV